MKQFSILCLLILASANIGLATHVNISISQQNAKSSVRSAASTIVADNSKLMSDSRDVFESDGRSARIQNENKGEQKTYFANHRTEASEISSPNHRNYIQSGHFVAEPEFQLKSMYQSSPIEYQRNAQFRRMDEQQKQNVEFERYIQNFHSGPTVETVYESADAMPSSHAIASRVNNEGAAIQRSGKLVQFERQVALPAPVTETENQQQSQQSTQHPSSPATSSGSVTSSAPNSAAPSVSVSTAGGSSLNININQRPASVGSDGLNFDQTNSYNKPNYNDPNTFKYHSDSSSDSHFHNQYPPTVQEPQGGYGGYYQPSGHHVSQGYLPPEAINNQRPVVTKTIQIAQPAIKTKKYEVRHPAIQKEFYDIEERVVIKPAGTVVVELERPVAKIPKGESILPLGHPHPAVANAYMNNGNTPSFSNILYSAAGSSNQGNQGSNQYSHGYNSKQPVERSNIAGSTIASSITSTPSFDQGSKAMAVEANLNKQYNGENHYSATPAPVKVDPKIRNREVIVVTDGQGNQRQVSSDQFPYSQARSGYNLRSYSNQNVAPQRTNIQSSSSNREPYNFDAEYVNVGANGNIARDAKPARLEEAPIRMEPVIKHGHSIALPASQHKIYLTQKYAVPQSQYVEENAHVQEVSPHHILNRKGPVVVYATSKHIPEVSFRQSGSADYHSHALTANYRPSSGVAEKTIGSSRLEISAPYAQMRYNPDDRSPTQNLDNDRENRKFGRLIVEDKSAKEASSSFDNKGSMNTTRMDEPQTHIEINIPESSQMSNKPITVSSTIRPMMSDDGQATHNAKLEISVTNNGEPKKEGTQQATTDSSKEMRDREFVTSSQDTVDCEKRTKMDDKFMRLVEAPSDSHESSDAASSSSTHQTANVDVTNKGSSGHVISSGNSGHAVTPGSRVIAATPAPRDTAAGSESFHKRRIVVNHPFQTVREVVEHEPYTNYHEVQVSEPASPALYHSAAYFRSHGALRQAPTEERHMGTSTFYHK
ncbi:uncharacterized protein LOC133327498 [Musca vetustissima]|uniref:uncharacterized protein LOC133327498 n=1 Tax=Musca vetustissima TaxID=27455 RepID=UPI002AB70708|nr:uncharacterized protein LOC133327498 [Musca vetustissima]